MPSHANNRTVPGWWPSMQYPMQHPMQQAIKNSQTVLQEICSWGFKRGHVNDNRWGFSTSARQKCRPTQGLNNSALWSGAIALQQTCKPALIYLKANTQTQANQVSFSDCLNAQLRRAMSRMIKENGQVRRSIQLPPLSKDLSSLCQQARAR